MFYLFCAPGRRANTKQKHEKILHLTVPACDVLASMGEPKCGRSGVSECERSKA